MPSTVICLAGPTGCGKTALAIALSQELGCEIINADSRQVYNDFPIITAQPTQDDQNACPHHLYGFLPSQVPINAGQWIQHALTACEKALKNGHIPLLVGGTGLYFEALLSGLADIPKVDANISQYWAKRIASEGAPEIYQLLQEIDPAYAQKVHPNDQHRIQRAMEVWAATGKALSWWHKHAATPPRARGPLFVMSSSLAQLEPRLYKRIDKMLAAGAEQEAREAWQKCPDANAPAWSGIGCAELLAFIQGNVDKAECKRLWAANTRAYAKRQLTWFKARKNAVWLDGADNDEFLKNALTILTSMKNGR